MSERLRGLVSQDSYRAAPDGVEADARMNRRGELIVPDWITQMAIEGRVFEISNPTRGTAVAMAGTSFVDTTPAILVDVPSGTTMIPLEIILKQGGTVAGGLITVLMTVDNIIRYASGGTAQTVRNNRVGASVVSSCPAYTGATAAAVGIARTFFATLIQPDVTGTADVSFPGFEQAVTWSARQHIPPVLVGPASLLIYSYAGTTAPSWFYTVRWLEVPSTLVV